MTYDQRGETIVNEMKKHVVITGAGSGLGAALAYKYNEQGYHVTLIGRTIKKLEQVTKTFKKDAFSIYALDVSAFQDVESVFKQIVTDVQPIDILVNNAGVGHFALTEDLTADQINQMIDVNLKGTIFCTQQVLGDMKARNSGSIINVISTAGVEGKVTESAYCASKFGARGFTESLIKELEQTNVQAHGIYMGGMQTPFWDGILDETVTASMMDPADIADIILANTKERPHISVPEVIIKNR